MDPVKRHGGEEEMALDNEPLPGGAWVGEGLLHANSQCYRHHFQGNGLPTSARARG